ncbi:MAG: hypothetical protein D6753_01920 [Planctomycetota bacterium]|nr:MAG: hypothetical protein D6753_01920 [Planctomycetota bacterium]
MEGNVTDVPPSDFHASATAASCLAGSFWHQVWCARRELQVVLETSRPRRTIARATWIVFDPLSRASARIGYVEHWLLTRLNGRRSLGDLARGFLQTHPGTEVTIEVLQRALQRLQSAGWVRVTRGEMPDSSATPSPQRSTMLDRLANAVTQLAVWRIRGINPDPWLQRIAPRTDWFFSRRAVMGWLMACVMTTALVGLDFTRFAQQTMGGHWIADSRSTVQFFVILLVTRALHELGHAIVCRRLGIRCPDIGVLLILGAPCVYCDVSESWRLPHRSGRAAVAAAGVYAELLVATVAAWIWLVTVEGPINTGALQTMLICSASTLVINLNPLMRYDGYYLLSDWLDAPNLRARADEARQALLRYWLLGQAVPPQNRTGIAYAWASFSLASWGYRCMLSLVLAVAAVGVARSWNVVWAGKLFAVLLVGCWVAIPFMRGVVQMGRAARSKLQLARLIALAAIATGAIVALPVPTRRWATGSIQPARCYGVYATVPGHLAGSGVADGQTVSAGQELFRLLNPALEREIVRRTNNLILAQEQLAAARRQRDMHSIDVDLAGYRSAVHAAESLLASVRQQSDALHIRAPTDGTFYRALAPWPAEDETPDWRPVSARWGSAIQVGRSVGVGQLLGVIAGQERVAVIPLSETQLADIALATPVDISLHGGQRVVRGTVSDIGRLDQISGVWTEAFAAPELNGPTAPPPESSTPVNTAGRFAALVTMNESVDVQFGTRVQAVFHTPSQTLVHRFADWMRANLRFLAD